MPSEFLLPNKYKLIGWCLLIPVSILGIILTFNDLEIFSIKAKTFALVNEAFFEDSSFFQVITTNVTPTILGVLFIIAALMVGFSKEKKEDEFIASVRLSSLVWAVWVNYILLFLCFALVYGGSFFTVMIYNMFTVLIIFIVRFHYILYKHSKSVSDEQ